MSNQKEIRQKLLKNDQTIDSQVNQLKGMERTLNETEQIGIAIKQELYGQKEKIIKTTNTVINKLFFIFSFFLSFFPFFFFETHFYSLIFSFFFYNRLKTLAMNFVKLID